MPENACLFVDGENLRFNLIDLLRDTGFTGSDYLPNAKWDKFFDWVVYSATAGSCRRLRTYWYVIDQVDYFPYNLSKLQSDTTTFKRVLSRSPSHKKRLEGLTGDRLLNEVNLIVEELIQSKRSFANKFEGRKLVQDSISMNNRAVTFRRSGGIKYNLLTEQLGEEKTVDVALACDLVTLHNIYDTAIIISGDQDYVPAAMKTKDMGRTVINVAFEKRNGQLLPGGARRLSMSCDHSISVPHARLLEFMAT